MAGFVEFFYNIIPGGLLVISIYVSFTIGAIAGTYNFKVHDGVLLSSIFAVVSLFLGFSFQMINKLSIFANFYMRKNIGILTGFQEPDPDYLEAKKRIELKINRSITEPIDVIHFAHNYLSAEKPNSLMDHFHFRISLWANIMVASSAYIIFLLTAVVITPLKIGSELSFGLLILLSLLICIGSFFSTWKSQRDFYNLVLKTFLMVTGEK